MRRLLKNLPNDPTIPLPGIYPEETIIEEDTYTPVFIAALFTIVLGSNLDVYGQRNG